MSLQRTLEDKLLLCQVVYSLGAINWESIAYKLREWSQDRGNIINMNPEECQLIWLGHLKQAGLVPPTLPQQQRLQYPHAPPNLELVKRLFVARLQELYHQIKEKEDTYQIIRRDIADIRRGAWDGRIARQRAQEAAVPRTASSSSSQLSSIDSPIPTPAQLAPQSKAQPQEEKPEENNHESRGMEGVEEDVTLTGEPSKADMDALLVSSPSVPANGQPSKEVVAAKLTVEEATSHSKGADDEDKEDGLPQRELRSRKPDIEPIEIPTAVAARRGKARKPSDSTTQASTRSSKRRGATETSKAPHSPGTASAAGTFDSAPTPAGATEENASIAEDDSTAVRKSTRSHKRKASEMDVDLPVVSKKMREHSSTAEDEPMTPAVASGGGRIANPRLRPAMTQIVSLLTNSKHSELFRRPVSKKDAPDYAQAVLKPMDLATIQRNIKAGKMGSWDELQRDLRMMLANCFIYNRPGTTAYENAKLMLDEVEKMLENAREAAQS